MLILLLFFLERIVAEVDSEFKSVSLLFQGDFVNDSGVVST